MSVRDIIDFAQTNFGNNGGLPNPPVGRTRLPAWLEGRVEGAVPIEPHDTPRIEGSLNDTHARHDPTDGASVDEQFAFYLPFHFYRKTWGIYVRAYGIDRLARLIVAPKPLTPSGLVFSFRLLLQHERLHFLAELAASRVEVTSNFHSYGPYFENPEAGPHEEALANAHALSSVKRVASTTLVRSAREWMSKQPAGYRDFHKWLGSHFSRGKRKAAAHMIPSGTYLVFANHPRWFHCTLSPPALTAPRDFLFDEPRRWNPPTYLVIDVPVPWLRFVRPFPKLFGLQVKVHTNDHKPRHIHILVLQRHVETRYAWPALRPLRGDPALSRSEESRLQAYVNAMRDEIDGKVNSVQWK